MSLGEPNLLLAEFRHNKISDILDSDDEKSQYETNDVINAINLNNLEVKEPKSVGPSRQTNSVVKLNSNEPSHYNRILVAQLRDIG